MRGRRDDIARRHGQAGGEIVSLPVPVRLREHGGADGRRRAWAIVRIFRKRRLRAFPANAERRLEIRELDPVLWDVLDGELIGYEEGRDFERTILGDGRVDWNIEGYGLHRSEERRVGKGGVSPCSYRWSPYF